MPRTPPATPMFVAVNNIPTPYRIHLFETMRTEFAGRGVCFEAWFMATTERGRLWTLDPSAWAFRSRIYQGLHVYAGRAPLHLNPGMVKDLVVRRPSWLLLGGSWLMPTVISNAMTQRLLPGEAQVLLWAEANAATSTRLTGPVAAARRVLYESVDACVVPGMIAEDTIRNAWGITPRRILTLPNIVDERVFRDQVAEARGRRDALRAGLGLAPADVAILLPARLHEATKGVLNFLKAVAPLGRPELKVLIAGEGPDRGTIEGWLGEGHLAGVTLLGHRDQAAMVELLAACDGLAMPSFRDPNPLAVVEALWARLPVIVSRACGNWPEAVQEGDNGWLIEPAEHESIRRAVLELLALSPEVRRAMGEASLALAETLFASAAAVGRFTGDLLDSY